MRKIVTIIAVIFAVITLNPLVVNAHTSKPTLMIPNENSEIEVMPEELTLSFSENLIQSGAAVSILDPSGAQLVQGLPEVSGNNLYAIISPSDYKGEYRITYKVTSADGAVNQGRYSVYVTSGVDFSEETSEPTSTFSEAEETTPTNKLTKASEADNYGYILLLGGGLAVIVGSILYYRKNT